MAKAAKLIEAQKDRPPQPISRERIRPRPRPLGEKDSSSFEPRPPPVDPVKEKAREVVAALKKKKEKKKRGAPEEAVEESGAKRAKVAPTEVEVPAAKDASEVVEIIPTVEVVEIAPPVQVEARVGEAAPSGREQVQRRPDPQEGGVRVATAIYHARAVAGRLKGEEGLARAGADRLVKIVDEGALRAASGYSEADLLRGLCFAQMEVTTLAGALLRKAGAAKLKAEEARAQLAKLSKDSANWKTAHADLPAVKLELEDARRKVVSLEFQLAGEQKKLEESERACAVAIERYEEAMTSNEELVRQKDEADSRIGDLLKELGEERARAEEERGRLLREWEMEKTKAAAELENLRKGVEEERAAAAAAAERGALQRELDEERAKAASEKAAYPDLCVAAVEQYKGSPEFQMVVDAAVARSLAGQESGGVGPSRKTAGGRTEAEHG
ncbi:chromatin-remodeling ATPase INO80-like [Camellia sinensis]|uniref:chromatin-remodeling ATPase INO80-like n=1 Tax=Camellia sinensis TaxID=4442 RepID=UPI0010366D6B|nr:chromatin-remodeling ATPase INO80-like [Camellia sinensis]